MCDCQEGSGIKFPPDLSNTQKLDEDVIVEATEEHLRDEEPVVGQCGLQCSGYVEELDGADTTLVTVPVTFEEDLIRR